MADQARFEKASGDGPVRRCVVLISAYSNPLLESDDMIEIVENFPPCLKVGQGSRDEVRLFCHES